VTELPPKEVLELILLGLVGAAKNMSLYPPNHPAIRKPMVQLADRFGDLLKQRERLALGIVEEVVVFEGTPFYDTQVSMRELLQRLQARGLHALEFRAGLTEEELVQFCAILVQDPEEVKAQGTGDSLRNRGIVHIVAKDAHEVYHQAVDAVSEVLQETRMGNIPRVQRLKEVVDDLTRLILQDLPALVALTLIKNYDNYLFNHSVNVSVLSLALAQALKVDKNDLNAIALAGMLHDVGKTLTPLVITQKPGTLTEEEWEVMRQHPLRSAEIVSQIKDVNELCVRIVREHHISFDRKGYPLLADGEQVHPYSKIVTVADCYDAITTLRPYQKPFPPREAMRMLENLAGRVIDPKYFQEFVKVLGIYPVGTLVRLDTNEVGVVVATNVDAPLLPRMRIVFDPEGRRLPKSEDLNLASLDEATGEGRTIVSTVDPLLYNVDPATLV
jgi:putative nucleotidyltransferase with HDIG domain